MIHLADQVIGYSKLTGKAPNRSKFINPALCGETTVNKENQLARLFYVYRGRIMAEGERTLYDDLESGKNMNQMAFFINVDGGFTIEDFCPACLDVAQEYGVICFRGEAEFNRIWKY